MRNGHQELSKSKVRRTLAITLRVYDILGFAIFHSENANDLNFRLGQGRRDHLAAAAEC
jgi:hypothetical protein